MVDDGCARIGFGSGVFLFHVKHFYKTFLNEFVYITFEPSHKWNRKRLDFIFFAPSLAR